jgi:hypothetical protein
MDTTKRRVYYVDLEKSGKTLVLKRKYKGKRGGCFKAVFIVIFKGHLYSRKRSRVV